MRFQALSIAALAAVGLFACADEASTDDGSDGDSPGDAGVPELDEQLTREAIESYADIVHASYADSLAAAEAMQVEIEAFLEDPSEATLAAARDSWLAAREPYLQTEVYRFYEGPIDNAEDGPEGFINAWPMDESYIDYVEGDDEAGIINDPDQEITADELMGLNEQGAEDHIATGYHAIEFLLWGQDLSDEGPGARPYTDFVDGGTAAHQDRRREYLRVVTDLLVTHLSGLVEAWADDEDNYRAELLAADPEEGFQRALTGLIVLSGFETGRERLSPALSTGEQEDEHSCFSDNTHRDMVQDVLGMQNVFIGRYETLDGSTVSGSSLHDVIASADEDLADEIEAQIETSYELAQDLQAPFDQEIKPDNEEGNERVRALITALEDLEGLLEEAFLLFGFTAPAVE